MRGQVSEFSVSTNQGFIMGEDGHQYLFTGNHWHHARAPMAGDVIEFSVDAQGHAVDIQTSLQSQPTLNLTKPTDIINPYQAPTQMGSVATRQGDNPVWAEEENYGFFDWVKKCFHNYANFSGRARRKEYWYFYLFFIIAYIVAGIIDSIIGTTGILAGIVSLAFLIPNLSVTARRLHDINKSGWWQVIVYLPFFIMLFSLMSVFTSGGISGLGIGFILSVIVLLIVSVLLLVWYATDTKPETNQWGMPARRV